MGGGLQDTYALITVPAPAGGQTTDSEEPYSNVTLRTARSVCSSRDEAGLGPDAISGVI